MKKLIPFIGLFLLPYAGQARHTDYRGDYLGLVGELTYIKESSESAAIAILNDPNTGANLKDRTIEAYTSVKQIDAQLIQQIASDARSRNSLCNYKKLDKMLTCHSIEKVKRDFRDPHHHYCNAKLEAYVYNLVLLEKAHATLMRLRHESRASAEGLSEMSEKAGASCATHGHSKVDYVCATLEKKQLCPVTALMHKPERKQEQTLILKTEKGTDLRIVHHSSNCQKIVYRHKSHKGKKCTCK
jgi:hypothetical protein